MSRLSGRFRSFFTFTRGERRGILWLLPLLAVIGTLIMYANRPRFEKSFLEQAADDKSRRVVMEVEREAVEEGHGLFTFDPNTVTLQELCLLGLPQRTAAGIIKYRERGKRFEIPEDFASCYGVSLEKYTELEPYIRIAERFRVRRAGGSGGSDGSGGSGGSDGRMENDHISPGEVVLPVFDPNDLDTDGFAALGFSAAQAEAIVRYRASIGGFRTAEDFGKSYVVSARMFERLSPYMKITPVQSIAEAKPVQGIAEGALVELNGADSTALRTVRGIGEVLVVRIMEYRERLGGYARAEQLAEIPGMTEENYNRVREQIFVDSCKIQKIDINFASHEKVVGVLGNHPYITAQGLRKLLKNRQLKGGWRSITDMVDENIVTRQQAERLAPYLIFRAE